MALSITCKDMGIEWCDFHAHADDEKTLIDTLVAHASEVHDIDAAQLMEGEGAAMLHAMVKET